MDVLLQDSTTKQWLAQTSPLHSSWHLPLWQPAASTPHAWCQQVALRPVDCDCGAWSLGILAAELDVAVRGWRLRTQDTGLYSGLLCAAVGAIGREMHRLRSVRACTGMSPGTATDHTRSCLKLCSDLQLRWSSSQDPCPEGVSHSRTMVSLLPIPTTPRGECSSQQELASSSCVAHQS